MALVKDKINALEVSDEIKAGILELFGQVEAKETEVEGLRKKVPTDSQKVVESVDFERFEAATKELETLKGDLQKKIEVETSAKESFWLKEVFPEIFS